MVQLEGLSLNDVLSLTDHLTSLENGSRYVSGSSSNPSAIVDSAVADDTTPMASSQHQDNITYSSATFSDSSVQNRLHHSPRPSLSVAIPVNTSPSTSPISPNLQIPPSIPPHWGRAPTVPTPRTTPPPSYASLYPHKSQPPRYEKSKHQRKSSKHHRRKKYKLLCLWPLPIVTRYVILISLIVSLLNFTGVLSLKCSAPSFVLHRYEYLNLLLSPFLFSFNLPSIMMAAVNLLTLGLFEESLTAMSGGTKPFMGIFATMVAGVFILRQIIGFVFSKSTGWHSPQLFFSDSLHECNQGLAPFLFSLLVLQSLSIEDRYYIYYGQKHTNRVSIRKITLQLVMCMLNYTSKNILWWSLTGLLTGLVATIILHTSRLRDIWKKDITTMRQRRWRRSSISIASSSPTVDQSKMSRSSVHIFFNRLFVGFRRCFAVIAITLTFLLTVNFIYTRPSFVDPATFNSITPENRYLLTFLLMTAPRPGDPDFLTKTIDSYLDNFPADPELDSMYSRTQMIVYTHFTNHTIFSDAKEHYSNDLKAQRYLKWVHEEGHEVNQRLHVAKALKLVGESFKSTYVALIEDDFPLCDNKWRELMTVVWEAQVQVPRHCGVFIGTGGSGLLMKQKYALKGAELLLEDDETPPDIILQNCLKGEHPACQECSQSLVTSKTLLMYHLGYNASTIPDRKYKRREYQCGWRHPFNDGNPCCIPL